MSEHYVVLSIVTVAALGVGAQWLAWRLRLPAIILLAAIGLVMGPGLDLLHPSRDFGEYLRPVISLCVAIILFEGGLSLQLRELKEAAVGVRRLVYLGVPLGWFFSSLCAHSVGGLDWPVSLVFGAIMVVTGPTVFMPLLRHAALNRRTASYLKWEGIINDPIGALLAVLVFQFFIFQGAGFGWQGVVDSIGRAVIAGLLFGGIGGWLIGRTFREGLVPEYLKSPVLLGGVLVVYAVSDVMQNEAGLLAVTIMGIVVGNMHVPGIGDMTRFKEYITIMLVSVLFVALTADLDLGSLGAIGWRGVAIVAAIMSLARPAAVMLATAGAGMELSERLLLSWIAPRGIVVAAIAGLMGPRLVDAGYDAGVLLPLVFAIIFATVFAHGLTINWLSEKLGLASKHRDGVLIVGASPWTVALAQLLQEMQANVLRSVCSTATYCPSSRKSRSSSRISEPCWRRHATMQTTRSSASRSHPRSDRSASFNSLSAGMPRKIRGRWPDRGGAMLHSTTKQISRSSGDSSSKAGCFRGRGFPAATVMEIFDATSPPTRWRY
jgi:NhaP-type Na+/H+ or K+/H+ antiporter